MAMSDDEETEEHEILEGRWLPLNSRRLNAGHLQLLAETLGLPTGMSTEELRQVIDGKLTDMEHDSRNVQVVIQGTARTELHPPVYSRSQSHTHNLELRHAPHC